MEIKLKRIYEPKEEADGFRILVDRLYPRGIKKEDLQVDLWDKEIAPSEELRKKFHLENNFESFSKKYLDELSKNPHTADFLQQVKEYPCVTLLTASKEVNYCQLPILKTFIECSLQKKEANRRKTVSLSN